MSKRINEITTSGTVSGKGTFSTNVPPLHTSAGYRKKKKINPWADIHIIQYESILDCNTVEEIREFIEGRGDNTTWEVSILAKGKRGPEKITKEIELGPQATSHEVKNWVIRSDIEGEILSIKKIK